MRLNMYIVYTCNCVIGFHKIHVVQTVLEYTFYWFSTGDICWKFWRSFYFLNLSPFMHIILTQIKGKIMRLVYYVIYICVVCVEIITGMLVIITANNWLLLSSFNSKFSAEIVPSLTGLQNFFLRKRTGTCNVAIHYGSWSNSFNCA